MVGRGGLHHCPQLSKDPHDRVRKMTQLALVEKQSEIVVSFLMPKESQKRGLIGLVRRVFRRDLILQGLRPLALGNQPFDEPALHLD